MSMQTKDYSKKKMYKKGKAWVVASVAVSALVGASQVSADEVGGETTSDNNVVGGAETTSTEPSTASTSEIPASQPAPAVVLSTATPETDKTTPAAEAASTTTEETASASSKEEPTATVEKAAEETPKVETTPVAESAFSTTTESPEAAANLAKLNKEAAAIVKEANLTDQELAGLTEAQIEALNKMKTSENVSAGTRMTYKNFDDIAKALVEQDPRYAVPFFRADKIENMKAATTKSAQTGQVTDLDVWDSWAVQNPRTKMVENWNGYQLAVAMMGVPGVNDNHLYLVYNKYGDNNLQNWKNAGSIFGYGLDELTQQWSGSAIVNSDGSIQLFYTQVDTRDGGTNHQKIASITLNLGHDNENVWIKSTENDQVIFEGDGYHYQTYDQWKATNRGADNIAMRDAHIVEEEDGSRYLVFEASTGTEHYQGENQIYDWNNYGGDANFKVKSLLQILNNDDITSRATWANAAIGILKLTNDEKKPQVEKLYTPLVTANMVSDEIERPSLVKLDGKYYLFAASRLNRGSNDDAWYAANKAIGDNVVMVGYVSDNLLSGYKPLNNSGVVLTASVPADWRTATYSYYAVPVEGYSDRVLITSYMTNRHGVAGKENKATWGPSFLVQILQDGTTRVLAKMTQQGDWIWDAGSETQDTVGNIDTAKLPGEDYIVDWDLIGYNLKDHDPHHENTPIIPEPEKPGKDTPVPDQPGKDTPEPGAPTPGQGIDKNVPVQRAGILPSTGSEDSTISVLAGLVTLMTAGLAAWSYRGKHQR